jgi:hypothetical protein
MNLFAKLYPAAYVGDVSFKRGTLSSSTLSIEDSVLSVLSFMKTIMHSLAGSVTNRRDIHPRGGFSAYASRVISRLL